ncbi:hypothetical protein JVU11DRAFT_5433 [Chiua virens]|nr:hypothetical protein JVU11DRAFT_5433 [Chiua virens]
MTPLLTTASVYLCTDINPRASVCTFATGRQNKVPLDPITCDLSKPLMTRLRHCVDIILFNPPYVPTLHEESFHAQDSAGIPASWAGGLDGMEVTNCFLENIGDLLTNNGKFYLVALAQNNIPEICEKIRNKFNMNGRIALQRRTGGEHLSIICFSRS